MQRTDSRTRYTGIPICQPARIFRKKVCWQVTHALRLAGAASKKKVDCKAGGRVLQGWPRAVSGEPDKKCNNCEAALSV